MGKMVQLSLFSTCWVIMILISMGVVEGQVEDKGQGFQSSCSAQLPCSSSKFLRCLDNVCECEDTENQIYDPIEGHCVILAGKGCLSNGTRSKQVPQCVQGGECDEVRSTCKCSKGFYETPFNICSYNIGKECSVAGDCDVGSGLTCMDKVCKCQNSSYIWQLDFGCITYDDIISSVPGDEVIAGPGDEVIAGPGGSASTSSPIVSVSAATIKPNGSEMESNSLTEVPEVPEGSLPNKVVEEMEIVGGSGVVNETATNTLGNGTGSEIGDRNNFLDVLIPNSPLLDILRPNPNPGGNRPNQQNFPEQLQNPNFQQNPQQNWQNDRNYQQQQQSQSQPNFQNPLTPSNNILGPNPSNNLESNDQKFNQFNLFRFQFPFLRRLLLPLKKFLFPGIDHESENMRLPSPIWLTVTALNQVLPVLRAIDYQVAPWLQTAERITRPRWFQQAMTNNNNINNNNYNTNTNTNKGQFQGQQNLGSAGGGGNSFRGQRYDGDYS